MENSLIQINPQIPVMQNVTVILWNEFGNHTWIAVQLLTKMDIFKNFISEYPNHIIYTIMTEETPLELINALQRDWWPIISDIKWDDNYVKFSVKNHWKDSNVSDILLRLNQEQWHGYFYGGSGNHPLKKDESTKAISDGT